MTAPLPFGDLDEPSDVAEMVRRFYRDVAQDDVLGPLFNDVAQVDWAEHIPKLSAFWCRILFGTSGYTGNPFRAHQRVHARRPFTAAHFDRWLELFSEAVDMGWTGTNAETAKALARDVARVHHHRLAGTESALKLSIKADALRISRAEPGSGNDRR